MTTKPAILFDPYPRTAEMVYDKQMKTNLAKIAKVYASIKQPASDELIDKVIAEVAIIVGQTNLDKERLAKAKKLKAIINVLGNWRPNIDYQYTRRKKILVLTVAPVMAPAVAEWTLAAMLNLGRGIMSAKTKFMNNTEKYGIEACRDSITLQNAKVGLIGFGNLAKEFIKLIKPFNCEISSYDPWVKKTEFKQYNVSSCSLIDLLLHNQFIAIFAGATTENEGFLNKKLLNLITKDTIVVMVSRAAVVEFNHLVNLGKSKKIRLAVDVFPMEPVFRKSRLRKIDNVIWSSHRAGADKSSYALMRKHVYADIVRILDNKPPKYLQAAPNFANKMRSI